MRFLSALQIDPTRSGGTLRSQALASALAEHGLDVFVHSLVGRKADYLARRASDIQRWRTGIEEYVDRGPLGFVAQYCSYGLGLPPIWIPAYLKAAIRSPGEALLPTNLRRRLGWCDVLVADFPFVHPAFASRSARGRLRVLSTHNVEHHLLDAARGPAGRWLRSHVRRIEHAAAQACDILVACCDGDLAYFEQNARPRRALLVPNGIDVRRFQGLPAQRGDTRRALRIADDVRVFLFSASKWGPNAEAFDYLLDFARRHQGLLLGEGIHILIVGNVVPKPVSLPGLTATGMVDAVEPYFAAADAALNPVASGAGTSLKMPEFVAARLPIVTTRFGARGFRIEDGRSGFLFERDELAGRLSLVRRLFDDDPGRLQRVAAEAFARNEDQIDMQASVRVLAETIGEALRSRAAAADPFASA